MIHDSEGIFSVQRYCAFYDVQHQTCLMRRAGVYIPASDHVRFYCTTQEFISCPHYQKGCASFLQEGEDRNILIPDDRRRYPRKVKHFPVTLGIKDPAEGDTLKVLDDYAVTFDIGLGGMGVETDAVLPVNQIVSFIIKDEAGSDAGMHRGEIRWSAHRVDRPRYLLGLSFLDYNTVKTMGTRMDLGR